MLAIVQARLSSVRLPGKMLMALCGRPMLGRVVDRLAQASLVTKTVVATSMEREDDRIEKFCRQENVPCYRGPLDDVAERFRRTARAESAAAFVRISGDSPLIDPALVDRAIRYYTEDECDLVSNVVVRSFPKGQSVEVLRTSAFDALCETMTDPSDREHVTKAFYANPLAFRTVSFTSGLDVGSVNLSVDTPECFARAERIILAAGERDIPGWRELLRLYQTHVG